MSSSSLLSADNHLFDLARTGQLRLPTRLSDRVKRLIDKIVYPIAAAFFGLFWPLAAFVALLLLALAAAVSGIDLQAQFTGVQDLSPAWLIVLLHPSTW